MSNKNRKEEAYEPLDEYATRGVIVVAAEMLGDKRHGEVSAVQLMMPTSFGILQEKDSWNCDTGESSHSSSGS